MRLLVTRARAIAPRARALRRHVFHVITPLKLTAYYFSALVLYAKLAKIKGPLILWDLQYSYWGNGGAEG